MIKYTIIFVVSLTLYIYCQVQIENLDSPVFGIRLNTLEIIEKNNLTEFIPEVRSRLFDQPDLTMQFAFLNTLAKLEDPEIEQCVLDFIENADSFQPSEDPLFYKVKATGLLFSVMNYSTFQFVFDLLQRDLNRVDPITLNLLNEIIVNVPSSAENATSELVRIYNNTLIDDRLRFNALIILNKTNFNQLEDLCLTAVTSDPDPNIRLYANGVLVDKNYLDLRNIYLTQLSADPESTLRAKYATSLLVLFGEPADLKTVIDYQPNEIEETIHTYIGNAVENFIPPKPASLNLLGKVTKLISYVNEMYSYQWIANTSTRDYYVTKLNLLKRQIESSRFQDACNTVNNDLLARIETDLAANNITIEGYKFLHYYCVYIKEDFPQGLHPCP